jgi:hypothetical protein
MDNIILKEIKTSKIHKTISHVFPYSIPIISSNISNIFNFIKFEGENFEVKPYIFRESFQLLNKNCNDSIILKYEIVCDKIFKRKVKLEIISINNNQCESKFYIYIVYYTNTCEYTTLVLIDNEIKINGHFNENNLKEIEIFKRFFLTIDFKKYLITIESLIMKSNSDIKLNVSCIINKPLLTIFNYIKDFNNILDCLKLYQKYDKTIIGIPGTVGYTLYLKSNKNRFKYQISFIEKNDEHLIITFDKTLEENDHVYNLYMRIYSLSKDKCIIFAETSLSSSFHQKQFNDFLKFMEFYAQNIKDYLEI